MSSNNHYTIDGALTQVLTGAQLTELRQVALAYLGLESELDDNSVYWSLYEAVKADPGQFDVIRDWVDANTNPESQAEVLKQIWKLINEIQNQDSNPRPDGWCSTADWSPADLAVVAREYLDLPTPGPDLERVSQSPALRGLLNAVRVNPGSAEAVRDWAACLTPDLRAVFAPAWEAALQALNRNSGPDTSISRSPTCEVMEALRGPTRGPMMRQPNLTRKRRQARPRRARSLADWNHYP